MVCACLCAWGLSQLKVPESGKPHHEYCSEYVNHCFACCASPPRLCPGCSHRSVSKRQGRAVQGLLFPLHRIQGHKSVRKHQVTTHIEGQQPDCSAGSSRCNLFGFCRHRDPWRYGPTTCSGLPPAGLSQAPLLAAGATAPSSSSSCVHGLSGSRGLMHTTAAPLAQALATEVRTSVPIQLTMQASALPPTPSLLMNNSTSQQQPATPPKVGAEVLDGKRIAGEWMQELEAEVQSVTASLGRPPGLAVILVGNRPDSLVYVSRKQEACEKVGMHVHVKQLPEDVSQSELEAAVASLCADSTVDGVLVQLPLPSHLSEESIMEHIDPCKDVDGFHPNNMGRMLMRGREPRLVPCTPLGCMQLLERYGVEVRGKNAVLVGDSNIVGTPLAAMLRNKGAAAVTVCHQISYKAWYDADIRSCLQRAAADACLPRLPGPGGDACTGPIRTTSCSAPSPAASCVVSCDGEGVEAGRQVPPPLEEALMQTELAKAAQLLPDVTRAADILVVAVGMPGLIKSHWVKPGAVVLDVGINVVPSGSPPHSELQGDASSSSSSSTPTQLQPSNASSAGSCSGLGFGGDASSSRGMSSGTDRLMAQQGQGQQDQQGQQEQQGQGQQAQQEQQGHVGVGIQPGSYYVVGDVEFKEVCQVASAITPVPGGVGPMTIAAVLHNTIKAARLNAGLVK